MGAPTDSAVNKDDRQEGSGLQLLNPVVYRLLSLYEKEYENLSKLAAFQDSSRVEEIKLTGLKYIAQGVPSGYALGFLSSTLKVKDKVMKRYDMAKESMSRDSMSVTEKLVKPYFAHLEGWIAAGNSLVLYGFNGSGKTYTAMLMLYEAIRRGHTGYYIQSKELQILLNDVLFKSDTPDLLHVELNHIKTCDLLVIDEIGKDNVTENYASLLEIILKYRTNENKSTILLSNLVFDKGEFQQKFGPSISNLLLEKYRVYTFSKDGQFRKSEGGWK